MGKDSGKVDTSGMTSAMQGEQSISKQEMDLANQMYQYGVARTAKYADPVLNEFQRIMGFGGTAAPTPAATYAPGTASGGAGGGAGSVANMFVDPKTGQLYSGDMIANKDGSQGGSPYVISTSDPGMSMGPTVQPYGGSSQNLGIGASTPWTGGGTTTATPTGNRYVSPLESSMFQLPVATAQAQAKQSKASILRNTKPGPQQTALLANVDNQMNQSLGQSAFSNVNNMLNALLGTSSAATTGMSQAATTMSAASQSQAAAGTMASNIANLQAQAQASNNTMLGSIFGSIANLGGQAAGAYIGATTLAAALA